MLIPAILIHPLRMHDSLRQLPRLEGELLLGLGIKDIDGPKSRRILSRDVSTDGVSPPSSRDGFKVFFGQFEIFKVGLV